MRTVFHRSAREELVAAFGDYHSESHARGRSFAELMHGALKDVGAHPFRFPLHVEGTRRCLILKFRHAIIYRVHPDHVEIMAIMHTSRRPGYWRSRLPKK